MAAMIATAVADNAADKELKHRLQRFYNLYAPEKMATIDLVVEKYRGRDGELFRALEAKYGPEPPKHSAMKHGDSGTSSGVQTPRRTRSIRFATNDGTSGGSATTTEPAAAASAAPDGQQQPLPQATDAAADGGGTAPPSSSSTAAPADNAASMPQPQQQQPVPPPATSAAADSGQNPDGATATTYGASSPPPTTYHQQQDLTTPPPPDGPPPASPAADERSSTPPPPPPEVPREPEMAVEKRRSYQERLRRFYEHYAPEKVANVDVALAAYKGREDVMFELLEAKYGPEAIIYKEDDDLDEAAQDQRRLRAMINASIAASPVGKRATEVYGAPFDHVVAAQLLGSQVDLSVFGPGNERYAAAFILMLHAIGPNALFDATQATLPMPAFTDREVTGLDRFAFEHVLHFRFVWIDAWFRGLAIRNHELAERKALVDDMAAAIRATRYKEYVRDQALNMISPIESDRRKIIVDEEALRYAGMLTWFRQHRDQLLLERLREASDIVVVERAAASPSHRRNLLTQEQSDVQRVLRTAGEALRRSMNRTPSPRRMRGSSMSPAADGATTGRDTARSRSSRGASPRGGSPPNAGGVSPHSAAPPPPFVVTSPTSFSRRGQQAATSAAASPSLLDTYGDGDAIGGTISARRDPNTARATLVGRGARALSPSATRRLDGGTSYLSKARRVAGARGQFSNPFVATPSSSRSTTVRSTSSF